MIEARLKLDTSEPFIKMARESPFFAGRFALVDSPDQFYVLRAYIDCVNLFTGYIEQELLMIISG